MFAAARVDWGGHIATLVAFRSWQLLGERDYEGNPLRAHTPAPARPPFTPAHYERWLELFGATVDDRRTGPMADAVKAKGHKVAAKMRRQLDGGAAPVGGPVSVAGPPRSRPRG